MYNDDDPSEDDDPEPAVVIFPTGFGLLEPPLRFPLTRRSRISRASSEWPTSYLLWVRWLGGGWMRGGLNVYVHQKPLWSLVPLRREELLRHQGAHRQRPRYHKLCHRQQPTDPREEEYISLEIN